MQFGRVVHIVGGEMYKKLRRVDFTYSFINCWRELYNAPTTGKSCTSSSDELQNLLERVVQQLSELYKYIQLEQVKNYRRQFYKYLGELYKQFERERESCTYCWEEWYKQLSELYNVHTTEKTYTNNWSALCRQLAIVVPIIGQVLHIVGTNEEWHESTGMHSNIERCLHFTPPPFFF